MCLPSVSVDVSPTSGVPYVYVNSSGTIKNYKPIQVVASCDLHLYAFPFDKQNCTLTFRSWLHSGEMCMCTHTHSHTHTHTHTHTNTHTHTLTHTHTHTHTDTHTHTHTQPDTHTHSHTHTHTHKQTHKHTHIHTNQAHVAGSGKQIFCLN